MDPKKPVLPGENTEPERVSADGSRQEMPVGREIRASDGVGESAGITGSSEADFWNLPVVRKKTYRAPTGRTTDTVPLSVAEENVPATEPIPPRDPAKAPATARPTRPADRTFRTSSYSTSRDFRDRLDAAGKGTTFGFGEEERAGENGDPMGTFRDMGLSKSNAGETVCDREGNGWLIRQVTVRRWINDFSFYSSFARDARTSHRKQGCPAEKVPFASFVPQYAHMDSRQLAYYLWFRDHARAGEWLEADFPYVLLYIFEILNLPDLVPPTEGIMQLCRLWAHYRQTYRKLDTYLCEWVPDYALIHNVPLPDCVAPFLPELVRRSQFKEFYLDNMCPQNGTPDRRGFAVLAGVLLEAYSDYDYTKSRHYNSGNREQYDRCITEALTAVLADAWRTRRGMFRLDRTYRLTRDSFCGAIIATEGKRRIDVAFQSCIRSPDTRRFVTGVVKYAENKLRARLKIRSKLNANEIGVEDKLLVDRYFGPEEVSASRGVSAEEPEYLKQYEAETTGFDFSAAHRIEADSWRNTSRLTGEALEIPVMEEDGLPDTEEMWVEGSLGTDALWPDRLTVPETASSETAAEPTDLRERGMAGSREDCSAEDSPTEAAAVPEQAHSVEKEAVAALLAGQYTAFCRERGLFPGRMAEQINEIFLELVGDILVEADGSRFQLIEDYREDAAAWSKT